MRDIDDLVAVGEQPGDDVPADSLTALDRPDVVRPRLVCLTIAA